MEDLQGLEMAGAQTLPATINGMGGYIKKESYRPLKNVYVLSILYRLRKL